MINRIHARCDLCLFNAVSCEDFRFAAPFQFGSGLQQSNAHVRLTVTNNQACICVGGFSGNNIIAGFYIKPIAVDDLPGIAVWHRLAK